MKYILEVIVILYYKFIFLCLHFSAKSSPLLLAASSGALQSLKCLIKLNADIIKVDNDGNNMVNLAALRFHTNILEYLIEWNHPEIKVWNILVGEFHTPGIFVKKSGEMLGSLSITLSAC